jgi:hypothetical protein
MISSLLRRAGPPVLVGALLLAAARYPGAQPRAIHLVASEYSFVAPETTPPGPTTFTLENRGTKFHEVLIGLLRPGAGAAEIVATHKLGVPFRQLSQHYLEGDASAALFAGPGQTSPASVTIDLKSGRSYVLVCQLRDSVGAVQHAAMGMFRVVRVE